jgi:hypothetical protein
MRRTTRFFTGIFLSFILALIITGCNYPGRSDDVADDGAVDSSVVESDSSPVEEDARPVIQETGPVPTNALLPENFTYQGAFRLPDDFAWGALGLSYYPGGDGGAGSLFVTGFQGLLDGSSEHC